MGRQPITAFRIRQRFCSLTYGTAPCTAEVGVTGSEKCFNTTVSCQDRDNLDLGTLDLWFVSQRSNTAKPLLFNGEPIYAISSLLDVSISGAKVNVGGGDRDIKALGTRADARVTIADHPHSDNMVDKYRDERTYIATERGTFWTKWLARNPYYAGYVCDVFTFYNGEDIADGDQRTYVLDRIDGPDNQVVITAKDLLQLSDDNRAQAPRVSGGVLAADISDTDTSLTVLTSQNEYPAPGTVALGDENIGYTSSTATSGGYILGGLTRGIDGTTADSHSADDTVQLCVRWTDETIDVIANDLITNYTQITDVIPTAIPLAEWQAEVDEWLADLRLTTVIREPTSVNQLLGELCRDVAATLFWDERVREIKLVAVKPSWPVVRDISDAANIMADSISIKSKASDRINEVWVYYLPRDRSQSIDEPGNMRKIRVTIDADSQSSEEYGDRKVRRIFSRWITTDSHAFQLASTVLARYRDAPTIVSVQLTAKDRDLWLTDIANVTHRRFVTLSGAVTPKRFQVISVKETPGSDIIGYEMETFPFFGRFAGWMADDAPDFEDADGVEKENGGFWSDDMGLMPDGSEGYQWQ